MPGITGGITFRGSKHINLLQWVRPSLTVKGSALPARSRSRLPENLFGEQVGEGRPNVLQENPPCGPGLTPAGILIFSPSTQKVIEQGFRGKLRLWTHDRAFNSLRSVLRGILGFSLSGKPLISRKSAL